MLIHGGPDHLGVARLDLSTNANACGPCPQVLHELQQVDARPYPDPSYTELRARLASWHGVNPARIVVAASASAFIQQISVAVALQAPSKFGVWQPRHAYGDYARAAQASGMNNVEQASKAALLWCCDPSSPLGKPQENLRALVEGLEPAQTLMLDRAYEPLRLSGSLALDATLLDRTWQLFSPNKALGLTGIRAAYAVAPVNAPAALRTRIDALTPSWPLGAHGAALLSQWPLPQTQAWLADSRVQLASWKEQQVGHLQSLGWQIFPSVSNFFVVRPGTSCRPQHDLSRWLTALRKQGVKLRDCSSFGLPGHVRMAVASPARQQVLLEALRTVDRQSREPGIQ